MKLELINDIVFLVEEKESLPDFPPLKRCTPVMTKEMFIKCYHKWILEDSKEEVKKI